MKKKIIAVALTVAMAASLAACGSKQEAAPAAPAETKTEEAAPAATPEPSADGVIYVMGPTPDHGWTAQAGAYANAMCKELSEAGTPAEYIAANDAEEQVDQIAQVIANGDARGVVLFAMDTGVATGEMQLSQEGIPFIAFDRIMDETKDLAILNYSGNNWQCGAGIAYYMQKNGLEPGDTWVTLYGDTGIVCGYREEGVRQFLAGELDYEDEATGETYHTTEVWEQADIDALFNGYSYVCDWAQDKAYDYLAQKLNDIVAEAKANTNKLYVCSFDDEMTFGFLNLLEGNEIPDATKADLENMEVCVSAIGGMEELYEVMRGNSSQSAVADQYFDQLCSIFFSPQMIKTAIKDMCDYLDGNWTFGDALGAQAYEPVFVVDRDNATEYTGFTGH